VDVDILAKSLKSHGLNAEPIHGDLDQSQRTRTLDGFRDGTIRFSSPRTWPRGARHPQCEPCVQLRRAQPRRGLRSPHRRTGRAGRKGVAISLSVPADAKYLGAIESLIEQPIPRVEAPWSPEDRSSRGGRSDAAGSEDDKPPRRSRQGRSAPRDDAPVTEATSDVVEPTERAPRRDRGERNDRRGRSGRDRNTVIGMGDHMPGFIAFSFDERRGGPPRDFTEDETGEDIDLSEVDAETEVEKTAEAPAAEEAPKPKRRRSRAKKATTPTPGDADSESVAEDVTPAATDSADTAA
jgi:superfamily II DNA/RNA helicase